MSTESYEQYQDRIAREQAHLDREQVTQLMSERSEHQLDLNNLPTQTHTWVDRGTTWSCEGGVHAPHRIYKRV